MHPKIVLIKDKIMKKLKTSSFKSPFIGTTKKANETLREGIN